MNQAGSRGDILIVDDTAANLKLLSKMLTDSGYRVRAARSGAHALAAVQAAPPDLILLDIVMPEMDGYEVCRHLKEDERTRDIPVLFISALGEVKDKVKAFTAGGVDYVTKPFQAEEVLARVRTHLALRNLTRQLQEANAELAQRVEELEERNAELDAFAHTVAHNIRGPLSILVGYSELLQSDEELSEDVRRGCVQGLNRGARNLSNIVDELLLLANIRKTDVVFDALDMHRIVSAACERLANVLQEYRAEVILPPQWPAALGHAAWVEEIWANYLSNGCKYGGKPPRLELGWDRPEGSLASLPGGKSIPAVRFWVRDNGNGISLEDQARLFVPFTRLSQVQIKGYGLGLSIVRRIVEKLGGQVGIESEGLPGHGSLFYFTLPAVSDSV